MFNERRLKEQNFECPEKTWSTGDEIEVGAQRGVSRTPNRLDPS